MTGSTGEVSGIEATIVLLGLTIHVGTEANNVRQSMAMADALDEANLQSWMGLQQTMMGRLVNDRDAGLMAEDQFDFAADLLSRVDQYDQQEAWAQFEAWCVWVRGNEVASSAE